jgi:hypothetical protein
MVLTVGQAASLDGYARDTLQRLPLADATLSLGSFVLQPVFLAGVFACYRGHSFEDTLTFPVFVELIGDALLQHGGSGRQSFTRAQEQGTLPTSIEAVYAKLRCVPLSLSLWFLAESTARLRDLLPAGHVATALPASLPALTVIVGDGKTLKRVAKRLLPARGVAGKVFGGKLLDAGMEQEPVKDDGILRVNWSVRQSLFDFDEVEITRATDEDVERFAVQVGNDTDKVRQRRYKKMRCVIAPNCQLSENTLRISRSRFGRVEHHA